MTSAETFVCEDHGPFASEIDRRRQDHCPTCATEANSTMGAWRQAHGNYARWMRSGIPARYRNRVLANFKPLNRSCEDALAQVRGYVDRLEQHYDEGRGLALIGPIGVGKTHLVCGALTAIIAAGRGGRFISTTDLFATIKAGFGTKGDSQGDDLLDELARAQWLVLDDLGAERGSEWEQSTLHALLGRRYDDTLPTIVTSNTFDLRRFVGDRVADRLRECTTFVELSGDSYRGRAADDEALRSAPPALTEPPESIAVRVCYRGTMTTDTRHDTGGRL